jgi:hypothetical protein
MLGIRCALRNGQIRRRFNEASEPAVGDGVPVHPEAVNGDAVDRPLLGIEVRRAHPERAAADPAHLLRRLLGTAAVLHLTARGALAGHNGSPLGVSRTIPLGLPSKGLNNAPRGQTRNYRFS